MSGLIRSMTRTAAVVGTATATSNAVNRRQAEKNVRAFNNAMNTAQSQQAPPQQVQPAQPATVVAQPEEMISQLERLGALFAQGLLTEEEFAAAKQRLIG